jgi:hypothetical protein
MRGEWCVKGDAWSAAGENGAQSASWFSGAQRAAAGLFSCTMGAAAERLDRGAMYDKSAI